jgi:hypothetical protein
MKTPIQHNQNLIQDKKYDWYNEICFLQTKYFGIEQALLGW